MRIFAALALVAPLAACIPAQTFYKANTSVAKATAVEDKCEAQAMTQAPVRMRTQSVPYYGYANGRSYIAGYTTQRYDANAGVRAQLIETCMGKSGFNKVKIDRCQKKDMQGATLVATMPASPKGLCMGRVKKGEPLKLVRPGK